VIRHSGNLVSVSWYGHSRDLGRSVNFSAKENSHHGEWQSALISLLIRESSLGPALRSGLSGLNWPLVRVTSRHRSSHEQIRQRSTDWRTQCRPRLASPVKRTRGPGVVIPIDEEIPSAASESWSGLCTTRCTPFEAMRVDMLSSLRGRTDLSPGRAEASSVQSCVACSAAPLHNGTSDASEPAHCPAGDIWRRFLLDFARVARSMNSMPAHSVIRVASAENGHDSFDAARHAASRAVSGRWTSDDPRARRRRCGRELGSNRWRVGCDEGHTD
jgi:hypothetical protein